VLGGFNPRLKGLAREGDRPSAAAWREICRLASREVRGPNVRSDETGWDILPAATVAASFLVKITGHSEADSPAQNRWKYSWTKQKDVKSAAGYGAGWDDDTLEGTNNAYNTMEDGNSNAGMQMNGVDIDGAGFPSGYSLQPIPDDAIVRLWPVYCKDGTLEYWFEAPNGIDGTCT